MQFQQHFIVHLTIDIVISGSFVFMTYCFFNMQKYKSKIFVIILTYFLLLCSIVEDIVSLIDNVAMHLTNGGYHDRMLQTNVIAMCNHMKLYFHQLESIYKGKLLQN